jgi:hypothetical protein
MIARLLGSASLLICSVAHAQNSSAPLENNALAWVSSIQLRFDPVTIDPSRFNYSAMRASLHLLAEEKRRHDTAVEKRERDTNDRERALGGALDFGASLGSFVVGKREGPGAGFLSGIFFGSQAGQMKSGAK